MYRRPLMKNPRSYIPLNAPQSLSSIFSILYGYLLSFIIVKILYLHKRFTVYIFKLT